MFRFLIPGLPAALKSKALRILDTPPMWLNLVRPSISVGYRKPEGAAPQLSSSAHDSLRQAAHLPWWSSNPPITCLSATQYAQQTKNIAAGQLVVYEACQACMDMSVRQNVKRPGPLRSNVTPNQLK